MVAHLVFIHGFISARERVAGANALRNHVPESRARRVIVAQQCVQLTMGTRRVI